MSTDDVDKKRAEPGPERSAVDQRLLSQPLRLLPLYEHPPVAREPQVSTSAFDTGTPESSRVLLRVGGHDLGHVCEAIGKVIEPAGVVIALSDERRVVVAAGRSARRVDVPLLTDTVFFRCALAGGRLSQSLSRLRYAPPPGHGPWGIDELLASDVRPLVRAAFDEQAGRQHRGWMAPTVALIDDPRTLEITDRLLAVSIETRPAFGLEPLIAPLIVDMAAYASLDDQLRLVRMLARHRPEAYLVALSGFDSSPGRLASSLRLLLLLKSLGVRVLIAKAGPLRAFAIAFGLDGFETGLGRLERFSLGDFKGAGGAGSRPAKFEISQLLTALPPGLAARAQGSGILGEQPCGCATCLAGWTPADVKGTVMHNAFVISSDVDAAATKTVPALVGRLSQLVSAARYTADELCEAGVDVSRQTAHLSWWAEAIEILQRWRLDDPGTAERLRDVA